MELKGLIIFIFLFFILCSCALPQRNLSGDGQITDEIYAFVNEIYRLKIENLETLSAPVTVKFVDGNQHKIKIRTDANIMDEITVDENKGLITISGQKQTVYNPTEICIEISRLVLSKIILKGPYHIIADATEFTENFTFESKGILTGDIDFTQVSTKLTVKIDGAVDFTIGDITAAEFDLKASGEICLHLSGMSEKSSIDGSGQITMYAPHFQCKDIYLFLYGGVDIIVYAEENLIITAEGSGKIKYRGHPEISPGTKGTFDISPYL